MIYVILYLTVSCCGATVILTPHDTPSFSSQPTDKVSPQIPQQFPSDEIRTGSILVELDPKIASLLTNTFAINDTLDLTTWPPEGELYGSANESSYGTWDSPLNATEATLRVSRTRDPPIRDPITGSIFWLENIDDGSDVVLQYDEDSNTVVQWTPAGYDVRTSINGYGGGSFTVCNHTLIFSNKQDGVLYTQTSPMQTPANLTDKLLPRKYGDLKCEDDIGLLLAVGEDPADPNSSDPIKTTQMVLFINMTTGEQTATLYHNDFFMSPRLSPDRQKLAWIERAAPNMPWDSTKLYVASLEDGVLTAFMKLLQHGSSMMLDWNAYNELLYVHDSLGWWNLHIINKRNQEINLTPFNADVGGPAWSLGQKTYDMNPSIGSREVAVAVGKNLLLVNSQNGEHQKIDIPYDTIYGLTYSKNGSMVYMLAANATENEGLIQVDLQTGQTSVIRRQINLLSDDYISVAHTIAFPTTQNETAYGNLYLPKNPDFSSPEGTLPPLLVNVHGGPTSASENCLSLPIQFFTTRGFAYLDLSYRGSSGYGKDYIGSLYGKWGILDVDDAIAGAQFLIGQKLVDAQKIGIRGGSAGGFTTLAALTVTDLFKAGTSYYGISDLVKLFSETHFFERGYLDFLIGSIMTNQSLFEDRSPIHNIDKISSPVLFFQGEDDTVVPLNQSKHMHSALLAKGVPSKLVAFKGEGHSFRNPENRKIALEEELLWYLHSFNIITSVTLE